MQLQWINDHPVVKSIKLATSIRDIYKHIKPEHYYMINGPDPSWLLPINDPITHHIKPCLSDYVQLPCYIWVPEYFYPELVTNMPCNKCSSFGTRQRWTSNGPRLIHGIEHSVFLYYFEYQCRSCKTVYKSIDRNVRNKLHHKVQLKYPFYTTANTGVTNQLLRRIQSARAANNTSLKSLYKEMRELRYERMYTAITDYYYHCDWYKQQRCRDTVFEPLPPVINNPSGYYDHEPIRVVTMSELYNEWCDDNLTIWTNYTQQLTADQVRIDSSHKVPKRVRDNAFTRLWSMVDIETGVILQQQMLTSETNADILPMLKQHVARCTSLGKPLPFRVCSDRGLMDENLMKHVDAFPAAHINVDPWHFQQLFM